MSVESQVCLGCEEDKKVTEFWPCHTKFSDSGFLPVCKDCKLTPKKPYYIALDKLEETGLL